MPAATGTGSATLHPKNGVAFNLSELAVLNMSVGFPREEVARATGIIMAESGGRPTVTSHNPDGNQNVGLFQIDTATAAGIGRRGNLKDPVYNARTAYLLWDHGGRGTKGWGIWETFVTGAYKKYMDQVPGIFGPHLTGATNSDPFGSGGAVDNAASGVAHAASAVPDFLGHLGVIFQGGFWLRVLQGLAGLILIGVGLVMAGKSFTPLGMAGKAAGAWWKMGDPLRK